MFLSIRVDSWEKAKRIPHDLMEGWSFRGHASSSWRLSTKLERDAEQFGLNRKILPQCEPWIIREFQRRAHHYLSNVPPEHQLLEWVALLQHHGGPTRLLDFSYSFYVAAFFAMENAMEDAAVWAINNIELTKRIKNLTDGRGGHLNNNTRSNVKIAEKILKGSAYKRMVLNVEPERLNERLSIQQGLFLFPCDLQATFEENLAETFGLPVDIFDRPVDVDSDQLISALADGIAVIKIVLARRLHTSALRDLQKMNITAATLFPGLDGFARSLSLEIRPMSIIF